MRKFSSFFLATFSFIMLQNAQAQNTSPYWSLAGNSNATTSSKLGTTNLIPLRLMTNNVERLRIDSSGRVGIGTTAPGSQLQVNSASGVSPLKVQINGFTKLYMNSGGGLSVGSGTSAPSNGLYVSGNVGIGTTAITHRLTVAGGGRFTKSVQIDDGGLKVTNLAEGSTAIYAYVPGYSDPIAIHAKTDAGTSVFGDGGFIGVRGRGATGVYGEGSVGVEGVTDPDDNGSGNFAAGVTGSANYGTGMIGSSKYGIGVYGQTANPDSYAGYFQGDVYSTGSYTSSDRKLKKNITNVTSAIDILGKLQPKSYEFRQDGNYKLMNLPEGKHYGLIAQDLEQVLPNLVKNSKFDTKMAQVPDSAGKKQKQQSEVIDFKAVNYTELIPLLVKAVQEQQAQIEELKSEISQLKKANSSISANGALHQATPNPSSGTTRISYTLPTGVSHAQLLVTDAAGKTIRSVSLNGSGNVDLNTTSFSSGMYNYSLMIEGNIVETKKLVVAR